MTPDPPPESLPTDDDILHLIRQEPGICLRQLAALLFPDQSWHDLLHTPAPPETGAPTRALWLRDRLRGLLSQGRLQVAPFRSDQPGLAGLCYLVPSA